MYIETVVKKALDPYIKDEDLEKVSLAVSKAIMGTHVLMTRAVYDDLKERFEAHVQS